MERRPELKDVLDDVVAVASRRTGRALPTCGSLIAAVEAALAGETLRPTGTPREGGCRPSDVRVL